MLWRTSMTFRWLHHKRSGIPLASSLERAILSCIAKSPADRPANAEALFSMLAACTDAGSWTPEPAEACGGARLVCGGAPLLRQVPSCHCDLADTHFG